MPLSRTKIARLFSTKFYPSARDAQTAKARNEGVKLFRHRYLGRNFPWVLGGVELVSSSWYETRDPNDQSSVIGRFPQYDAKLSERAFALLPQVRAAGRRFFENVPWRDRVKLLECISRKAQERFWLLCAAKAFETGQSPGEQVGETDEEVDFPLINGLYLQEIHSERLIASPSWAGNISGKRYVPHGVFLDVSPFNFPGAIPMDMATKALAMGNAVIEKSSPKASLCGYLVYETIKLAFEEMGIDHRGVINYAPGGEDAVNGLLLSPEIAGMSFTGSTAVINSIKERHGKMLRYGYEGRAPLIYGSAETSGVNVFILCEDADPEHAAKEYVKSVIGRQGQKCSSARMAFVPRQLFEAFAKTMDEALDALRYGDVKTWADMGAMITPRDAFNLGEQVSHMIGRGLLAPLYHKSIPDVLLNTPGNHAPRILQVAPHVLQSRHLMEIVMTTEFFGPVSSIVVYDDFEMVRQMCSCAHFALTGSIFSPDPERAREALRFIPAGNVYFNRKCTGALVETECFGGLRSQSSPNGMKGKHALLLFGSSQTLSGFGDAGAPPANTADRKAWERMLQEEGADLSKF